MKNSECKIVIIFFSISLNICFGVSKERSLWTFYEARKSDVSNILSASTFDAGKFIRLAKRKIWT